MPTIDSIELFNIRSHTTVHTGTLFQIWHLKNMVERKIMNERVIITPFRDMYLLSVSVI